MNHDAADLAMFWVGALFVLTPLAFFGVILGVWWYKGKQSRKDSTPRPPSAPRTQSTA